MPLKGFQDTALSRPKPGFDSPWGHFIDINLIKPWDLENDYSESRVFALRACGS